MTRSKCNFFKWETATEANRLTHLRAEAVSDVACLDITSIRALVVSENFDMSTGAGTLRSKLQSVKKIAAQFTTSVFGALLRKTSCPISHRFITRLRRYATAACDSAESTASRVVIYDRQRQALFADTTLCYTKAKEMTVLSGITEIRCVLQEQINYYFQYNQTECINSSILWTAQQWDEPTQILGLKDKSFKGVFLNATF